MAEARERIVGRRIVGLRREGRIVGDNWGDDGQWLVDLDDGTTLDFGAWGHDAWGPTLMVAGVDVDDRPEPV